MITIKAMVKSMAFLTLKTVTDYGKCLSQCIDTRSDNRY